MAYYLDLFTPKTWSQFRAAGAKVTGFRETNWARAAKIEVGDVFLCYIVGAKRWVGVLEIVSKRYRDDAAIWTEDVFPVRFKVKPRVLLEAEVGVPMTQLRGELSFYPDKDDAKWSGYVRSCPTRYNDEDGDRIVAAIERGQKGTS